MQSKFSVKGVSFNNNCSYFILEVLVIKKFEKLSESRMGIIAELKLIHLMHVVPEKKKFHYGSMGTRI